MKKRKKLLLLLCAALLLTGGCGSKAPTDGNSSSAEKATENNSATQSTGSTKGDSQSSDIGAGADNSTDESTANNAGTSSGADISADTPLYSLLPDRHGVHEASGDGSEMLLSGYYDTVSFRGDGFDALESAVADWQEERVSSIEKILANDLSAARQAAGEPEFYGYLFEDSLSPTRMDHRMLSLTSDRLQDGTEHTFLTTAVNFDVRTGKHLTLREIATDYNSFSSAVTTYVAEYVNGPVFRMQEATLYDNYEAVIQDTFHTTTWYFNPSGIVLYYGNGVLGDQAYEVTLPAETFFPYLKEDYLPADGPGLVLLPLNEPQTVKSQTESLTLCLRKNSDGEAPCTLTVNGTDYSLGTEPLTLVNYYLIRQQSGRLLLAMTTDWASDDYDTHFYEITSAGPRELWTIPNARITAAGADTVALQLNMDILGSTTAPMTYDISGAQPAPVSDEYIFDNARYVLTLVRDLPVTQNGSATYLPAGTSLIPISTDGQSRVTVENSATGEQYEFSFTGEGYNLLIDEVPQQEYFEMLPYVG